MKREVPFSHLSELVVPDEAVALGVFAVVDVATLGENP